MRPPRGSPPSTSTRPAAPGKAFALVTAGPGLTNIVTAVAGAWLESRELLVIGGQVKSTDLATGGIRQRGIQEVDGVAIVEPDLRARGARRSAAPAARDRAAHRRGHGRAQGSGVPRDLPGRARRARRPAALDARGAPAGESSAAAVAVARVAPRPSVARLVREARRPVLLVGGGVSRAAAARAAAAAARRERRGDGDVERARPRRRARSQLRRRAQHVGPALGERAAAASRRAGRARLAAGPAADRLQLPRVRAARDGRARRHRRSRAAQGPSRTSSCAVARRCRRDARGAARATISASTANGSRSAARCATRCRSPIPRTRTTPQYVDPFVFNQSMSALMRPDDVVIPCSSGGAFTSAMQAFDQRWGQTIITNKGARRDGLRSVGRDRRGVRAAGPARRAVRGRRRLFAKPARARDGRPSTRCGSRCSSSATRATRRSA